MGFLGSRSIGLISADENIKTYYIEYPNNWVTDTLLVDYQPRSLSTNCNYVLKSVNFNSVIPIIDTSFHFDAPVYLLNKQ